MAPLLRIGRACSRQSTQASLSVAQSTYRKCRTLQRLSGGSSNSRRMSAVVRSSRPAGEHPQPSADVLTNHLTGGREPLFLLVWDFRLTMRQQSP
jgi:hypothetical protein